MRIVIPSAGLGSRFLPLTRAVPKELLLLGEWPLIPHALLEAEGAGFESAIVVISPMKQAIRTWRRWRDCWRRSRLRAGCSSPSSSSGPGVRARRCC
ncbi:MAG: hypothetical protein E6I74_02255 [Chloroflexi bacterium]|nr:MAG: hypothetical protein E6I74_02255 [Chloroflexota bacterium]